MQIDRERLSPAVFLNHGYRIGVVKKFFTAPILKQMGSFAQNGLNMVVNYLFVWVL